MASAKMTLQGLSRWNSHLFDGLTVPEGADKEVLINNIFIRSIDFEVMYPDPDVMQIVITNWSKKWARTLQKWWDALQLEYNPIENYDRTEDVHDSHHTTAGALASDTSTSSASGTSEDKKSSYDSANYENEQKNTSSNSSSASTQTSSNSTTDQDDWHQSHIHGNIGVTTSQQMVESELELAQWSWYDKVTDVFLHETIIAVY